MLRLAFHPQAPNPHGTPRQPVRGPPRGPGPPRRLVAAQPRRLLPGQDGIPGGGGSQRCSFVPGAEVRLQEEDTPQAPPRGYHDAIRGGDGSGLWMLPWFQLRSSLPEARGWGVGVGSWSSSVAAPGRLRCHSPLLPGAGRAGGPAEPLPGITGQETHPRGRAPACARAPRLVVPGRGRCAQVR